MILDILEGCLINLNNNLKIRKLFVDRILEKFSELLRTASVSSRRQHSSTLDALEGQDWKRLKLRFRYRWSTTTGWTCPLVCRWRDTIGKPGPSDAHSARIAQTRVWQLNSRSLELSTRFP